MESFLNSSNNNGLKKYVLTSIIMNNTNTKDIIDITIEDNVRIIRSKNKRGNKIRSMNT